MLDGRLYDAPDHCRGFDCNQIVGAVDAAAFVTHGYRFVRRYVRRHGVNSYDLNPPEIHRLLDAGLAIAPVQHVEHDGPPWWVPTADVGTVQGIVAASEMARLGFPPGSPIALDLEGVAPGTPAEHVIGFAQAWRAIVVGAGFAPDLYVGRGAGLTGTQLYYKLSFTKYWRAGNLNDDEAPVVRGCCMRQHWRVPADVPPGTRVDFNVDTCATDAKGGRAVLFAREGWPGAGFKTLAHAST